jgi:dihydrofolate reductase
MVFSHDKTASDKPAGDLAIIAAVAANGVIGDGLRLPWRLPADLAHFRQLTTGHAVIMGRRTWQSLARPLPDRQSIVVSRNPAFTAEGAAVARSLHEAVDLVRLPAPAYVIGGSALFRESLLHATTFHLTDVHADYPGDVYFPDWIRTQWREIAREEHAAVDGAPAYSFVTLARSV